MRDRTLGLKMKLLSQIQAARALQDEEEQETRQQQGEEETLSTVKVEGKEEIALIESVVEDEENPLTAAFRKEKELKELEQKIETDMTALKNLELQKARRERRIQAHMERKSALQREMAEMMETRAKQLRLSL